MDADSTTPPDVELELPDYLEAAWAAFNGHSGYAVADLDRHSRFFFKDSPQLRADLETWRTHGTPADEFQRWERQKKSIRRGMDHAYEIAVAEASPEEQMRREWIARQEENRRIAEGFNNPLRAERRRLQHEAGTKELHARLAAVARAQRAGQRNLGVPQEELGKVYREPDEGTEE